MQPEEESPKDKGALQLFADAKDTPEREESEETTELGEKTKSGGRSYAPLIDIRVGNRIRVLEKLGAGSFGDIYRGKDLQSGADVAIKLEAATIKRPQLINEARLCKLLGPDGPRGTPSDVSSRGIPRVHWYGVEGDFNVMVVDLLGPSIEDLFSYCCRRFTLKTTCNLGKQFVSRIEYMHSKHMLHRDIKPDNFLTGVGKGAGTVYMIDFGLARPYRDPLTLKHVPYATGKGLSGTARYASRATHMGIEQSRRDDVEAIGYMLVYFLKGGLPWQGMNCKSQEAKKMKSPEEKDKKDKKEDGEAKKKADDLRTTRIGLRKCSVSTSDLCKGLPKEIQKFLDYCINLRFTDKPDYNHLRGLLTTIEKREGYKDDSLFDWVLKGRTVVERRQSSLRKSIGGRSASRRGRDKYRASAADG